MTFGIFEEQLDSVLDSLDDADLIIVEATANGINQVREVEKK